MLGVRKVWSLTIVSNVFVRGTKVWSLTIVGSVFVRVQNVWSLTIVSIVFVRGTENLVVDHSG